MENLHACDMMVGHKGEREHGGSTTIPLKPTPEVSKMEKYDDRIGVARRFHEGSGIYYYRKEMSK